MSIVKKTCELYTDIIPALYQEELAEWLRTKKHFHNFTSS